MCLRAGIYRVLLSWFLFTHTLCFSSFAFLVSFLITVTIYLTDDRRPAEGGVRLAYKQDFKIAAAGKDLRVC